MTELIKFKSHYHAEKSPVVTVYSTEFSSLKGKFVTRFVERWGMVAAEEDGEDSKGRAKLKLSPPQDVVDRAFVITDLLFEGLEKRGLIMHGPSYDELVKEFEKETEEA